ncbi:MAG TPA: lmo0937 family membrane protein [Gemmatimonadaceae bacterium]|nr:lmo0937 family membrane protein [Gemmatimonadaceae bacterium]
MLLIIGCVLLVLWLLGFVLLKKTVGAIIHVLLIIAIIAIVIHFLGGRAVP